MLFLGLTFVLVEGAGLQGTLASTIGLVTAICYNYLLHYHWTFDSEAPHGSVLVKYLLMCGGGVLLNALVMQLGLESLPIHYMLIQLLSAAVLTGWSICVSMFWVFNNK